MLPSTLKSPTRSAFCWLLGVFSDVPLAVTVKGLPVNAARTPFTCQSLAITFRTFPYPLLLCHGSAYAKPNWKLCLRSKPAGAQLRPSSLGVFHVSVDRPSLSLMFI